MKETPSAVARSKRWAAAVGLVAAGMIGGGAVAAITAASAATTTTATTSTSSSSSEAAQPRGNFPAHGTAAHEALEKPVTGANATKAQAAAEKAVGSGTAGAVTTDVSGNGYEVTVKKADGTSVEVHLDGSFALEDHGRLAGG
jgi:hypothetical protein